MYNMIQDNHDTGLRKREGGRGGGEIQYLARLGGRF